jgi:hypothetical protein
MGDELAARVPRDLDDRVTDLNADALHAAHDRNYLPFVLALDELAAMRCRDIGRA